MPTCTVTGTLRNSSGVALPNTPVSFLRGGVFAQAGAVILERLPTTVSDAFGEISIDLLPGVYLGIALDYKGSRDGFQVGVPDAPTADLADIIDQAVEITPSILALAVAARDAAIEAADRVDLGALDDAVAATAADRLAAETARTASESARDAAFVNADAYISTEAGIAATVDGAQFVVVEGEYLQAYNNDAGTAVAIEGARYPTAATVAAIQETIAPFETRDDPAIVFTDTDNNGTVRELASITPEGRLDAKTFFQDGDPLVSVQFYETRIDFGGVPFVDTDAEGVLRVQAVAPTEQGGGDISPQIADGDIRQWAPDIVMDGVTDQSGALKSAHDSAAAAGYREIYMEGPIAAPTALRLGDVHFRTRTGRGRLVGTYRKRVIPDTATTYQPTSGIIPEQHLKRLRAKLSTATTADPAVLVFVADSWGQSNQLIGWPSQFGLMLEREVRRQFGPDAEKIRVVNRAIGGKVWGDILDPAGVQPWASNPDTPWIDYITTVTLPDLSPSTRTPDVVMFLMGMNYGTWTAETITDMQSVIGAVEAVSPSPDVILCTGTVPSANSPTRGAVEAQEARRRVAAYTRNYAKMRGLGLIDFGRAYDASFWGFDTLSASYRQIASSQQIALPYSFPQQTDDFAIRITQAGGSSSFWSTGDGLLTVTLSPVVGNRIVIERDSASGNIAYTVFAATDVISIARTVTTTPAIVGAVDPLIEVAAIGEQVVIFWRSATLATLTVDRSGGLFTPVIGFGGSYSLEVTAQRIAVSEFASTTPTLTDFEAWGGASPSEDVDAETSSPIGGNDENHLAEPGREVIFGRVLAATRFGG